MKRLIAPIIILCVTGCSLYKETKIEADNGAFGCWVHIQTTKPPTLEQVKAASEKYIGKNFDTCKTVSGIRFYLEGSGQGSYLITRGPEDISFTGTAIPRHRWNEAEDWGESYCKEKGVTCKNQVKANGSILRDPVWASDTPVFVTP